MKRRYFLIITAVLLTLILASCGSSSGTPEQDDSQDSAQEQTETTEEKEAEEEVNPYAWLGFQDIPKCDYLDILSTNHYYQKSAEYVKDLSYVNKRVNAVDGINTYKKEYERETYSIEGKVTTINESNKTYMEQDSSDMAEYAKEQMDNAMKEGTNLYGRAFEGTGTGTIPVYSEETDDKTEYEYYEYSYPDFEKDSDNKEVERIYMKDGDVFAIYKKITMGDTEVESAEIIKKMSGDIPDGTFELPDLSGYEKLEY